MTQEQLTALLAQVQGNANLQETLSAAQTPEEVVRIAHAQGYEVSSNELIPPTEHDLEGMAGGSGCYNATMAPPTQDGPQNCGKTGMWVCLKD